MSGKYRSYEPPPGAADRPVFRSGPAPMTDERQRKLSQRSLSPDPMSPGGAAFQRVTSRSPSLYRATSPAAVSACQRTIGASGLASDSTVGLLTWLDVS